LSNQCTSQRAATDGREDEGIGFLVKYGINIHELDSSASQLGAIGRFTHVGLSAKHLRFLYYSFFEGQAFEGVQGVVVNKHANRALRGKHAGSVFNSRPNLTSRDSLR
jgi:hypothetical protein